MHIKMHSASDYCVVGKWELMPGWKRGTPANYYLLQPDHDIYFKGDGKGTYLDATVEEPEPMSIICGHDFPGKMAAFYWKGDMYRQVQKC